MSPALTLAMLVLRIIRSFLPITRLHIGKLISVGNGLHQVFLHPDGVPEWNAGSLEADTAAGG